MTIHGVAYARLVVHTYLHTVHAVWRHVPPSERRAFGTTSAAVYSVIDELVTLADPVGHQQIVVQRAYVCACSDRMRVLRR